MTCLKFLNKCCDTFIKKKKNVCVREFDNIVVRKSDVSPINGENGMNIEHHNLT